MPAPREIVEVDGHEIGVSNPDKVFFPDLGLTKIDLVRYYLAVAGGALTGARDRPTILKRYPNGIDGDFFFQKRVPPQRPEWIRTAFVRFPSGRTAEFLAVHDAAHLAWMVNLGCIEINPWAVRGDDVEHPDELRIDLDPTPEVPWTHVREVALVAREVLAEHGLVGWPRTSGKRGMHVTVRIERRWEYTEVRRAALALAREIERRSPLATTEWWKEQRHGVFVDYNMNARDRTLASTYSVRPAPDARVACALDWDEVPGVDPAAFTMLTVPARLGARGDPHAAIDAHVGLLEQLLELAARDEAGGLGDAPWPPHFPKQKGEPTRVQPSRARQAKKRPLRPRKERG